MGGVPRPPRPVPVAALARTLGPSAFAGSKVPTTGPRSFPPARPWPSMGAPSSSRWLQDGGEDGQGDPLTSAQSRLSSPTLPRAPVGPCPAAFCTAG
eukprot:10957656-Lingulodinium_polyedra.AAC.1